MYVCIDIYNSGIHGVKIGQVTESMYVFMYLCVCDACRHVCTYVSMYACMYVCVYVCMYVYMYVCMYVCMCMCVCVYACVCVPVHRVSSDIW